MQQSQNIFKNYCFKFCFYNTGLFDRVNIKSLWSFYNACDSKKIFVLFPALVFTSWMIIDVKQSFGLLSRAEGRLAFTQRGLLHSTLIFSEEKKKKVSLRAWK